MVIKSQHEMENKTNTLVGLGAIVLVFIYFFFPSGF